MDGKNPSWCSKLAVKDGGDVMAKECQSVSHRWKAVSEGIGLYRAYMLESGEWHWKVDSRVDSLLSDTLCKGVASDDDWDTEEEESSQDINESIAIAMDSHIRETAGGSTLTANVNSADIFAVIFSFLLIRRFWVKSPYKKSMASCDNSGMISLSD